MNHHALNFEEDAYDMYGNIIIHDEDVEIDSRKIQAPKRRQRGSDGHWPPYLSS
jgi:hypothetical protein